MQLILWDSIKPSSEWIESQIPDVIKKVIPLGLPGTSSSSSSSSSGNLNNISVQEWHTLHHSYIYLLAGACFSIGIRFAGTFSLPSFSLLYSVIHYLLSLKNKKVKKDEFLNKYMLESCISTVRLSFPSFLSFSPSFPLLLPSPFSPPPSHSSIDFTFHCLLSLATGPCLSITGPIPLCPFSPFLTIY